MSVEIDKQRNGIHNNTENIERSYNNMERFISYKLDAWYDNTKESLGRELDGSKPWKPQFLSNLRQELARQSVHLQKIQERKRLYWESIMMNENSVETLARALVGNCKRNQDVEI